MQKEARLPTLKARLNELMGDLSATKFAEALGLSRQTVGFYLNGDRIPDAATLIRICQRCDVSSDWLLGLSDVRNPDASTQSACAFTGLSERSIELLRKLYLNKQSNPNDNLIETLSAMMEQRDFFHMLAQCGLYIKLMSIKPSSHYQGTADYIAMSDALSQHGFVIANPSQQANAIFSEQITGYLRLILGEIIDKSFENPRCANMVDLDEFLIDDE